MRLSTPVVRNSTPYSVFLTCEKKMYEVHLTIHKNIVFLRHLSIKLPSLVDAFESIDNNGKNIDDDHMTVAMKMKFNMKALMTHVRLFLKYSVLILQPTQPPQPCGLERRLIFCMAVDAIDQIHNPKVVRG